MANKIYSSYKLGDMSLIYVTDDGGHIGMLIVPESLADKADVNVGGIEPLTQIYLLGDPLPGGFAAGLTMSAAPTSYGFKLASQEETDNDGVTVITTVTEDGRGYSLRHTVSYRAGNRAVSVKSEFVNNSGGDAVLEDISSFSIGMLTPFGGVDETNKLRLYRARSWWSDEGRIESGTVEEYHLEQSWALHGARTENFGQIGSMPVRQYFPFAAIEDEGVGAVWAAQLAIPSSWQMEFRRQRNTLSLTGGLADYDYGHWRKTVHSGESFETPEAYITAACADFDAACQRLLDLHTYSPNVEGPGLPLMFNEYCTTWGNPNLPNVTSILDALKGHGFEYFVIDAGWYTDGNWSQIGDWNVSENRFPGGMKVAADRIKAAGMKPGVWFELENCTEGSEAYEDGEMLLRRDGYPITTGRTFLDMKKEKTRDYLRHKVIDMLAENGFEYIKIDYNDSIGVGSDDPDGLGEGLRKSVLATQSFMDEIHKGVPGIVIECCSSGGHRLEPSFLNLCDMASFSDAHECVHIPIIAAHLQRLMQPAKSQVWAVLRKEDSLKRLNYSLINGLLGVLCVSGDVYDLSPEAWELVDRDTAFYKKYSPIIRKGTSFFYGPELKGWSKPEGWQAVARYNADLGQTLVTVHTFGGEIPDYISIPVKGKKILDVISSQGNEVSLSGGYLNIEIKDNFEAIAVAVSE